MSTLAVTGIMIVAAGLVTLSTTAASAAATTASAPGHATGTTASAATTCVDEEFGIWDEGTYETCVYYEQILLNDLARVPGGGQFTNQVLTTDGYYGPDTTSDVEYFQSAAGISVDGITGPQTWTSLCYWDYVNGWDGAYWKAAGCPVYV
jgi:peptidoglycan hydrolase-like protein with peptidoglycan-binding domain